MNNKNNVINKVIKVVSPSATLKSIEVGEIKKIGRRYIKENVVRATASRLNKNGYSFNVKGTPDGTEVTRNK